MLYWTHAMMRHYYDQEKKTMTRSRVMTALLVLAMSLSLLAGCGANDNDTTVNNCEHEWLAANCKAPKTCRLCGETTGTTFAHQWTEANCEQPKTCRSCKSTEGEALGHTWTGGDCLTDKVCSACEKVGQEAPGHDWKAATTEAPKTCKVCGETTGDKLGVNSRFDPTTCQGLIGNWKAEFVMDFTEYDAPGVTEPMTITIEFSDAGFMTYTASYEDPARLAHTLTLAAVDMICDMMAAQMGMDKAAVEAMYQSNYGMSIYDYMSEKVTPSVMDPLATTYTHMYYVEDGVIYHAEDWNEDELPTLFLLQDGKLLVEFEEFGVVEFTQVAE